MSFQQIPGTRRNAVLVAFIGEGQLWYPILGQQNGTGHDPPLFLDHPVLPTDTRHSQECGARGVHWGKVNSNGTRHGPPLFLDHNVLPTDTRHSQECGAHGIHCGRRGW